MPFFIRPFAGIILAGFLSSDAHAQSLTCDDLDGAAVFSEEFPPTYLGFFGSPFASDSIDNTFGTYGSEFSHLSATNPFTSTPPTIFRSDTLIAFLTANTLIFGGVSLEEIDQVCPDFSSVVPIPEPSAGTGQLAVLSTILFLVVRRRHR